MTLTFDIETCPVQLERKLYGLTVLAGMLGVSRDSLYKSKDRGLLTHERGNGQTYWILIDEKFAAYYQARFIFIEIHPDPTPR